MHEQGTENVVQKQARAVMPEPSSHLYPPQETVSKPDGVRVLVVDESVDAVTMLTRILRDKGYSVQSAYSGPQGLRIATQWRPEIVLLDIGLPDLDGYEIARRLRADPTWGNNCRLIALTGYGQEKDLANAREAGFNGHLVKPYDFDELERLMTSQQ